MIYTTQCCGVKEIHGLSTHNNPKTSMMQVCNETVVIKPNCAFLIFTADIRYDYGDKFAKFIRDNKLGGVRQTLVGYNPNSTHNIRAWMWQVNWDKLRDWYNNNK